MKVPINMISLEDAKKTLDDAGIREIENPLYKPKVKLENRGDLFSYTMGNAILTYAKWRGFKMKKAFLKEFELEKEDASLFWDGADAGFLERPRSKWGDTPLDKAAWNLLQNNHFLAVRLRLHLFFFFYFTVIHRKIGGKLKNGEVTSRAIRPDGWV